MHQGFKAKAVERNTPLILYKCEHTYRAATVSSQSTATVIKTKSGPIVRITTPMNLDQDVLKIYLARGHAISAQDK